MTKASVTARGGLNLRKSPKTGKVLKSLRKGSIVEILEQETWLKVKTRDGSTGYVLADYIEKDESAIIDNTHADALPAAALTAAAVAAQVDAESDQCELQSYANSQFIGTELRADSDFIPHLDRLNQYARDCGVKIYVTSSAREPGRTVRGNIVPPARRSNHLVGHAIDMNLQSASGFFTSTKLKKKNFTSLPSEIKQLIDLIRQDEVLRWGGDFRPEDPVHIDDNLNNRNGERWDRKLASRR